MERRRKRYSVKSSLTYFAEDIASADHEFNIGIEYSHNPIRNQTTRIDDVFLRFNNGEAFQVDLNNTPRHDGQTLDQSSAYIDDIITSGRFTLKLGLRWDRYHGWLPEQNSPDGTWCTAANGCPRTFAEQKGVLDLASFAPRLGLVIGLEEGGQSALKSSWGRYYHQFSTGFANFVNQNGSLRNRHEWNDLNGDRQFQNGEQGAILSDQFGAQAAIATVSPDLKHEYTDEFTLGLEREFEGDVWVQATFSVRNSSNKSDQINLAAPDSAYDPMQVPDPGPDGMAGTGDDGAMITVYNLRPEFVGLSERQIATVDKFETSFKGFEMIVQKRLSNNWQALLSYSRNDTDTLDARRPVGEHEPRHLHQPEPAGKRQGQVLLRPHEPGEVDRHLARPLGRPRLRCDALPDRGALRADVLRRRPSTRAGRRSSRSLSEPNGCRT